MKKIILLLALGFLTSCQNKDEAAEKKAVLPESNAKLNNVSIIIENDLWKSEIGDSLRSKLSAPTEGLPQDEAMFDINQYPPKVFKGFATKSRNVLVIEYKKPKNFTFIKDEFAIPQAVMHISGQNITELIEVLEEHQKEIIKNIQQSEIKENQRRMTKSLLNDQKIKDKFGISLKMSSSFKYDMDREKFIWLRKQFKMGMSAYSPSGENSIIIYEVPYETIEGANVLENILQMRSTIGKANIEGALPNTFMDTDRTYRPYFYETTLANKKTYITKGIWELKNDFMSGPFINYAIKDEKNNRYLVVEGFSYFPSQSKRELVLEIESIIQSIKFL